MAAKKTTTEWPNATAEKALLDKAEQLTKIKQRALTFDPEAIRARLKQTITDPATLDRYMKAIIEEDPPGSHLDLTEISTWTLTSNKITGGTGGISLGKRLDGNNCPGLPTRITLLTNGIVRVQVMQSDLRFDYIYITEGSGYWK